MGKTNIRFALVDDAKMLADLARETFWDAYNTESKLERRHIKAYMEKSFTREILENELIDKNLRYLIAESDSIPVGYAKLAFGKTRREISGSNPAELCRIYLKKKFWGKAFGSRLLETCIAETKANGSDTVWLSVWEHNAPAIRFYEKRGFGKVGSHVFDLASSPQTDFVMQKDLREEIWPKE